ncbi:hypothetical protein [Methylobacterium brachythecii]|uniref:Uncharacterized protein n=1 Tax=Methylobacterium brachythecii TaxID=1176177 RepID=A0A7W6AIZ2_9HYPH|nr:hypothetical protein [Methylobacterium brachythecii]MBB3904225.1 hypothetical protein [Methylobacterium brachythecii]
MQSIAWHWHRFMEWVHQLRSLHHYERGDHHAGRALEHGVEADRHDARTPRRPAPGAGSEPECEPETWGRP